MARISLSCGSRGYAWLLAIAALLALVGCARQDTLPLVKNTAATLSFVTQSPIATLTAMGNSTPNVTPRQYGSAPSTPPRPSSTPVALGPSIVAPLDSADPASIPRPESPTPFPPPGDTNGALIREKTGFRAETRTGEWSAIRWSWGQPAQLEAQWVPDANATQSFFSYFVDPASGTLRLADGGGFQIRMSEDASQPLRVLLFDARTGREQTVFSLDTSVAQWTPEADRRWDFEGVQGTIAAHWIGEYTFILSITPVDRTYEYDPLLIGWGKILLINTAMQQVSVLAEQGQLVAVFPDGSLLLRRGWVDGAMQLIIPPYTGKPFTIASGGPWTSDWTLSPDGRQIAWIEWTPPTEGDWSRRLPHRCCSGEPQPKGSALVIWDQATHQLKRFLVDGIVWSSPADLHWRSGGRAIRFSTHREGVGIDQIAQFELGLDGRQTELISGEYGYTIRLVAEGPDGACYAYLTGHPEQNTVEIFRRSLDGVVAVVRAIRAMPDQRTFRGNPFLAWSITEQGHIIERYDDGTVVVLDIVTGKELARLVVSPSAEVSPDGRWIAYIDGSMIRLCALP
jgi:hypothetical protein